MEERALYGEALQEKIAESLGYQEVMKVRAVDGIYHLMGIDAGYSRDIIPAWHEDINAALELIPIIKPDNFVLRFDKGIGWMAILATRWKQTIRASAATPALAICRAYLAAYERITKNGQQKSD